MSSVRPQLPPDHPDELEEAAFGGYEITLAEFAQAILWMTLLATIAIVFNAASLAGGFIDQDGPRVTQNLSLRAWSGLSVIWRWPHQFPDVSPLTYTLHLLEARVWGIQGDRVAMWYRAVNVLIHAASVVLVFQLMRRLAVPGAFAVAAVFAVHPANASAVAWVAQRPAVLGTFFALLSLIVLLRIVGITPRPLERHRLLRLPESAIWLWLWAIVALSLTVTASPALAAALGPILLWIAWWKRGRPSRHDWLAAAPLLVLSLVVVVGAVVMASRRLPMWEPMTLEGVGLLQRPTAALCQALFYLWTAVAPFRLQFAYQPPEINWLSGSLAWIIGGAMAVAVVTAARRGNRAPAAALASFVVLLLPALAWPRQADLYGGWVGAHLLYPATLAVIAPAVAWVAAWLERRGHGFERRGAASIAGIAATIAIVLLGGFAIERGYRYQSQRRLWTDTIHKDPTHLIATVRLGATLMSDNELAEAERLFREAARLQPGSPLPVVMLGELYERRGRADTSWLPRARDTFIAALALDANNFDAVCGKARTLQSMGDSSAALVEYERARQLRPRDPMLHNNIGLAHFERGEHRMSEQAYRYALSIDPRCTAARINLANLMYKEGKIDAAAGELLRAVEIDPNSWEAFMNAGAMLGQMGEYAKAARLFRTAIYLKSDLPDAYGNLGMALIGMSRAPAAAQSERLGMLGEAAFCFERAAALNPQNQSYLDALQQVKELRQSLLGGAGGGP